MAYKETLSESDRKSPFSIDAERSVLGGLILDNDCWDEVYSRISASDFYLATHKLIFSEMEQLQRDHKPIDWLTLSEELQKKRTLDQVGGQAYIAELAHTTPTTANIESYSDIVRELSIQRKLLSAATNIADQVYHPEDTSTEEMLNNAEREILAISNENQNNDGGPQFINPLLTKSVDQLNELINRDGDLSGISTGFDGLNEKTNGLQDSDLIIVAARPSMGKTTFAMNLVENALLHDSGAIPCLVFSLEMPAESIIARMLASVGAINQSRFRDGKLDEEDWTKYSSAITKLKDKPLYIDDTSDLTPYEMAARARRVNRDIIKQQDKTEDLEHGNPQTKKGLGLIMVDYLQLMRVPGMENNRTLEISEISRSLKSMAKEFQCPVIALAQLNRSLESRQNKQPVNSDLRESGGIEQDADLIMFIYRDVVYEEDAPPRKAKVIIGKHRNGPIGSVPIAFEGHYSRFVNPGKEELIDWGISEDE